MAKRARTQTKPLLPFRLVRLHGRLFISIAVGVVVAAALMTASLHTATRLLVGWDAGVLLYLTLIYSVARQGDIARLRQRAAEEDESAIILLFLTFVAAIASLAAIV